MNPSEQEQLENEVEATREVKQLRSKFLDKFFLDKERQLFEAIKDIPIGDGAALENIHHQLKSLNALQVEIQTVMNTGKMANMSLEAELDKKKH